MQRKRFPVWFFVSLMLPSIVYGRSYDIQRTPLTNNVTADWSYQGERGPDNWGNLSATFAACQSGSAQSPIDLVPSGISRLPPLRFHYRSSPLKIHNDGLTIRIDYSPGSYLRVGNISYELKELDFRVPGEHTINGRQVDMEIQLLHQDSAGNYVILAIPVTSGVRRNAMLQRIWEYLPGERGSGYYYRRVGINPIFFLPADRRYFRYQGSLTDPPCSEDVTWFVIQNPVELSGHGIDRLRRIMGENNRPVQPVNGRSIFTSR